MRAIPVSLASRSRHAKSAVAARYAASVSAERKLQLVQLEMRRFGSSADRAAAAGKEYEQLLRTLCLRRLPDVTTTRDARLGDTSLMSVTVVPSAIR